MPLQVGKESQNMQSAMETAVVQGLQQKYEVFSGENVTQKVNEIYKKESLKSNCDETRCMEGIAMAFNTELIAVAKVTKIEGGYLLVLNIRDVMSNKAVYNNSMPCKGCDLFQVVDKLKELSGAEAQATNSAPDQAEAPSINKAQEQDATKTAQQDQSAWDKANKTATVASYEGYLKAYPQGQYATLAIARIAKVKRETPQATARVPKKRVAMQSAAKKLDKDAQTAAKPDKDAQTAASEPKKEKIYFTF